MDDIEEKLANIKESLGLPPPDEENDAPCPNLEDGWVDIDEMEEVCQDEIDADKAVREAVQELYINALLEREPEGDA